MKKLFIAALFALFATCAVADEPGIGDAKVINNSKVVAFEDSPAVKACLDLTCNGHGSAVHIGNGYFLTAAHVAFATKPDHEWILKTSRNRIIRAKVVWVYAQADLALMKATDRNFDFVSYKMSCRDAERGEEVTVIGNPDELDFITTHGKIMGERQDFYQYQDVYPLDVTAYFGNSGGPVLDKDNEVIALVVAGIPGAIVVAEPTSKICDYMPRGIELATDEVLVANAE